MKDKIKGKMVKEDRPRFDNDVIICECLNCIWQGNIEDTKINDYGTLLCPHCRNNILIYEN